DLALDIEQRINPAHCFQRHRRGKRGLATLRFAFGNLRQVSEFEEFSPGMRPTRRLGNWPRRSVWFVEFVVSAEGIGLQNTRVFRQVGLRMFAAAVAGIIKHRRRWRGTT